MKTTEHVKKRRQKSFPHLLVVGKISGPVALCVSRLLAHDFFRAFHHLANAALRADSRRSSAVRR